MNLKLYKEIEEKLISLLQSKGNRSLAQFRLTEAKRKYKNLEEEHSDFIECQKYYLDKHKDFMEFIQENMT